MGTFLNCEDVYENVNSLVLDTKSIISPSRVVAVLWALKAAEGAGAPIGVIGCRPHRNTS